MNTMCDDWQGWYNLERPEEQEPPFRPPVFGSSLEYTDFHKLLMLRVMRPDRLLADLTKYIQLHMGPEYVDNPTFDLVSAYQEASPSTPLLFVLFPGVDPTNSVERLGESFGCTSDNGKFINISMGQVRHCHRHRRCHCHCHCYCHPNCHRHRPAAELRSC